MRIVEQARIYLYANEQKWVSWWESRGADMEIGNCTLLSKNKKKKRNK